jgi:hypothetical protein
MVVASQSAEPASLVVSGPGSRVQKVEFVETDPVDVRSLNAQGEAEVNVYSGDSQVHFAKTGSVRVKIALEPIH